MSLRLRLTLIITVVLAMVLAIFGAGVYALIGRNLRHRVDERIKARAEIVSHAFRFGASPFDMRALGFGPPDTYVEIVDTSGQVLFRSETLGPAEIPVTPVVLTVGRGAAKAATFDTSVSDTPLRIQALPLIDATTGQPAGAVLIGASLQDVADTLRRLRGVMLLAGIAGIALAAALGWRSARTALRPVEEIGAAAQEIGATGDLTRRVSAERSDELGRLAEAFNTMLARLQAAQESLSRSLETQRRFVDDASHELRTPLTIMRGNLELVARDPNMPAAERETALRDAIAESERMTKLVEELLSLARVDAGVAMPDDEVSLANLVHEVMPGVRSAAGKRIVSVAVDTDDVGVRGSAPLLRRVIENLTDNAIKYTGPSGSVSVRLGTGKGDAILTVTDDGIGMSNEEQAHLFDRFWRSTASRERPGSGLGLAIAKAVVDAHGGSIEVASRRGSGTTVTIRLPQSGAPAPPAATGLPTQTAPADATMGEER